MGAENLREIIEAEIATHGSWHRDDGAVPVCSGCFKVLAAVSAGTYTVIAASRAHQAERIEARLKATRAKESSTVDVAVTRADGSVIHYEVNRARVRALEDSP